MAAFIDRVSIIIPARNEAPRIAATIGAVLEEVAHACVDGEVVVVDDGSHDLTGDQARQAGARVIRLEGKGNPGAARNRGAAGSSGELLVFLDADCMPATGWLAGLLTAHARGEKCVGGPLALPPDLPSTARWDYYFSSYHMHPDRPSGPMASLTPANLSVRREAFESTRGFDDRHPVADGHEELSLQASLRGSGIRCYFEQEAVVYHHNRPGMRNLLRRTYRWAYSSIQAKAGTGGGRLGALYRYPWLLVAIAPLTAPLEAIYIAGCWVRAGKLEPILVFPVLLVTRLVYAAGMMIGGWRWLTDGRGGARTRTLRS